MVVGLTCASGIALVRSTEHDWRAFSVTAVATLLLAVTELHPVVVLVTGAGMLWLRGGGRDRLPNDAEAGSLT
jgi:chromate transporter